MAQIDSKLSKDAKPAEKKIAKIDTHSTHKKPLWSTVGKKLLLPASILFVLVGLALAAYSVLQIVTPDGSTMSLGLKIASIVLGLLIAASGVLGLFKQRGKHLMTLGALSLVYAIIILTATAKMGTIVLVLGIVAVVASLFYVFAVDGKYETGLIRFFREMTGEVKKLTWLSGKELFSHTLAVIVFVLAMAALIYLLDLAFSSGFGALSSINIG
ncbi:MAG: preprotein translocase subunit SecE [Christensenella sp.]|nr:preprotein translocase subunit SecE [Christensenella sp.]